MLKTVVATLLIITSANEVGEVMFSPLFVCEQLPDHNFSCGDDEISRD